MYLIFKVYKPYYASTYDFVVYVKGFSTQTPTQDDFDESFN